MAFDPKFPKAYRPWVRAAVEQGWTLSAGRGKHLKLTAPDGYATPIPESSTSTFLFKAWRKRLTDRGVTVNV